MTQMTTEVEIAIEIITTTQDAILVESLGDDPSWIPKSQISDYACGGCDDINKATSIFIPEWLAIDKDLL